MRRPRLTPPEVKSEKDYRRAILNLNDAVRVIWHLLNGQPLTTPSGAAVTTGGTPVVGGTGT